MIPSMEKPESKERLDEIGLKVLRSLKVSEEEIAVVADSSDLYGRLRSRIEAGPRQPHVGGAPANGRFRGIARLLQLIPVQPRAARWLAAAAVLMLLTATLLLWRSNPSGDAVEGARVSSPATSSEPQQQIEQSVPQGRPEMEAQQTSRLGPSPNTSLGTPRHRRARSHSSEVATEFFPLTFIADSRALESGQVVRVRMPRSALVSFGVPMNVERAGELVKADVVIGDDGLARAIRFIQ